VNECFCVRRGGLRLRGGRVQTGAVNGGCLPIHTQQEGQQVAGGACLSKSSVNKRFLNNNNCSVV
jgi:hypothetical protein